jgi:acyl-[acyl-carrier-protein]-phospholipid O-acyltransferase/long-chain-fatty-acid--[acyl-carrier-protein] ligase
MSIGPEDSGISGTFAPVALCKPPATQDGRGSAYSRSFLALVATQFFVSLNDNMFRWLVVPVGKELMDKRWGEMPEIVQRWMKPEPLALALGLASFTLPFLVFAAPAGFLADRFSKRNVMVAFKAAEVFVVSLGVAAILIGSVPLMFVMLFLLGAQATMFITSKLGAIPEIVRSEEISAANGLINMVSMSAIIVGNLAGNWLYTLTKPGGQNCWWIYAAALLGVATCGFVTSLFIGRLRPANPARPIPWNLAGQTVRDLAALGSNRPLLLVTLGSAYFWALGALSQINIDQFATKHLGVEQQNVGPLLAALILGIGGGALLAGMWSRGKVELGLVPLGGLGIAVTSVLVAAVPGGSSGHFPLAGYGASCFLLLAMGVTAGLYDIPLQAFIQDRSPVESRGSIMAAYNFLCFAGMLAASGVYWLLSGPLGLSASAIFVVGGIGTVLVTFFIVRLMPFQTMRLAVRLLTGCVYRVRVEGVENVPPGGALVVANHISWADGVLLGLACPRHPRMIAFAQYFDSPWLGWFGRLGRIIPIGSTRKSMAESIRAAREALRQGELVGIFPEGGITRTGEIQEFRPGFLSILKDSGAPVVPVYLGGLWGSIFSFERGRFFWKWPRRWPYPVTIRFGKPIPMPESVDEVRRAVEKLKEHVG